MMQGPVIEGVVPFSHEVLIEMYQNIDYSKRAKTLQIFMVYCIGKLLEVFYSDIC